MNAIYQRISDFLMQKDCGYTNPHQVTITLYNDLEILVSFSYPKYHNDEQLSFDIFCIFDTIQDFLNVFKIKSFADLGKIKSSLLEDLYSRGIGQIYCLVGIYEMTFLKKDGYMIVTDSRNNSHTLQRLLFKSEEFIDYTRHYYKLGKSNPADL